MKYKGIPASEGISIAKAFVMKEEVLDIKEKKINNIKEEIKLFESSKNQARIQIGNLKKIALKKLGEEKAAIFGAHLQILDDPSIEGEVKKLINDSAYPADYSLLKVSEKYIGMFESMDDPYMKERAADIKDVTTRLLKIIKNIEIMDLSTINEEVIIVAEDLSPSETAQMDPTYIKGFATNIGGKTSHSAIMARTLEIPAVVGLKKITNVKNGEMLILSGSEGVILSKPTKTEINEYTRKIEIDKKLKNELVKFINKDSVTHDGHKVEIAGNIGTPSDVESVLEKGGEAIGLFRSEFLYMNNSNWPTEEEQFKAYKYVVENMKGKKVIIRTLDIGGDKKLDYFSFPEEMNPFLGYRAVRFTMDKKEVFSTQIRALLRSAKYGSLYINLPMVATINEFKKIKKFIESKKTELEKEKIPYGDVKLGIMVEIPSTAIMADKFAKHVDFFSIGSNDLIQYTFAADRMSEKVSYLYQPYNPSILRLIKSTIDASHDNEIFTAMCGEMANDEIALPLLVGLGLDEFSMAASSILKSRYIISRMNYEEVKTLANKALELETTEEVEKLVKKYLNKIL